MRVRTRVDIPRELHDKLRRRAEQTGCAEVERDYGGRNAQGNRWDNHVELIQPHCVRCESGVSYSGRFRAHVYSERKHRGIARLDNLTCGDVRSGQTKVQSRIA